MALSVLRPPAAELAPSLPARHARRSGPQQGLSQRSPGVYAGAAALAFAAAAARRPKGHRQLTARSATEQDQWFSRQAEQRTSPSGAFAERGLALLEEVEAPARKQEAFRYTDLEALLYGLPEDSSQPPEVDLDSTLVPLLEEVDEAYRLVFVDGELQSGLCRLPNGEGAFLGGFEALNGSGEETKGRFDSLLQQLPEVDLFEANPKDRLGCAKLAALNQAVFKDAACVALHEDAPETRMDIVFATTGARATAPRVVLDVGPGSKLKVLETHLSLSESDEALSNGLCRVVAGEGAEVHHEVIQQKAGGARWVQSVMAEVAEGASYSLRSVQSGSRAARLNAAVALGGEKSFGELTGVMLADTKQQLDLHSLIHHSVPSCRSKQQHKNLVGGSAECIFKGTIRVDAEAQQTESSQLVRSLLLTKKSKVKAMPSLQIQADDVSCSHGAALTQLDKDELFYLASRGLDGRDARRLMLAGFPTDLLDGLKDFAPKAHQRVLEKLASMAESSD